MKKGIEYVDFEEIDRKALLCILNKPEIRTHLIEHEKFTLNSLNTWVQGKIQVSKSPGCRVKAIKVDGVVAGWCGIQFEQGSHELAIVLDNKYWGIGLSVYKEAMKWASELGHETVVLHLLHTRPEYRFLKKRAKRSYTTTIFGESYASYELAVENP